MQKLQNCWSALYKAKMFAAEQTIRYKMDHDVIVYKRLSNFTDYTCKWYRPIIGNIHYFALEPFLCILPIFQSYGNVAVSIDNLNKRMSGETISFLTSNRTLGLGFLSVSVVLLTRATFCIVLFVCSVSWLFLLGCQYQCKWLTGKARFQNDLPYNVLMWTLNPTHSSAHSLEHIGKRKRIYIAPLLKYLTLKALRYGSHSVTCK